MQRHLTKILAAKRSWKVEDANCLWESTVYWPQYVCYEEINSLCESRHLACCRRQLEWIKDSVVYTVIVFVGSQIQVGQHWFPSLIYPAKASLCQRPVRAIHTYIYLWRVTCQSHSEPWAVSLGPALQACSYNTFCQTCCSIVLWEYCLTHLPFWLVSHDCTHQTIHLPFTHVQRALATTKHHGKSQHTELCSGAVQGLQCR